MNLDSRRKRIVLPRSLAIATVAHAIVALVLIVLFMATHIVLEWPISVTGLGIGVLFSAGIGFFISLISFLLITLPCWALIIVCKKIFAK